MLKFKCVAVCSTPSAPRFSIRILFKLFQLLHCLQPVGLGLEPRSLSRSQQDEIEFVYLHG